MELLAVKDADDSPVDGEGSHVRTVHTVILIVTICIFVLNQRFNYPFTAASKLLESLYCCHWPRQRLLENKKPIIPVVLLWYDNMVCKCDSAIKRQLWFH